MKRVKQIVYASLTMCLLVTCQETESNIKKKELPKAILKVLDTDFEDVKIVEIEKVDHATKGIFYDVEIKVDDKKKDLEFTKEGKRIN